MKIATKDKILISTLKLIDNKPFPQVSTKEIAELTGISEGLFSDIIKQRKFYCKNYASFLNLTTTLDLSN